MNKELEALYNERWAVLKREANKICKKPAHPLLVRVSSEYEESDIKVMIVGQETDGWNGDFRENSYSIDFLMRDYEAYLKSDSGYKNHYQGRLKKKNQRPFWNKANYKYFENGLKKLYPSKEVSSIWNNISKIGKCGRGKAPHEIENLEKLYFNILNEELSILRPNIVIFTTGPTRDNFIKDRLSCEIKEVDGFPLKNIAEIVFPEKSICSYRTYHPNYRKGRSKRIKEVLNLIEKYFMPSSNMP